jgi:hypothetical protein
MDPPKNLITNPTFIWGSDHGWQPMCCSLSICDQPPLCGPPPSGHQFYCVAHNRTQAWQGIAQDLTGRIKAGLEYTVEACVSIAGPSDYSDVQATLKLENVEGQVNYSALARSISVTGPSVYLCVLHFVSALEALCEDICIQNLRMNNSRKYVVMAQEYLRKQLVLDELVL